MIGAWFALGARARARVMLAGGAAVALLAARGRLEDADERLSQWLDRTSDALQGHPPIGPHARAWRAAASRRLLEVARIAADLSGNTGEPTIENATERIYALLGMIEELLDVISRERTRVPRAGWGVVDLSPLGVDR